VNKPSFVYVTYITSTPEKVWNALIDPALTKQYWFDHRNVSDWSAGSPWQHIDDEDGAVDVAGTVLESDAPRRLVLSWAAPDTIGDADATSRVTFDLETESGVVKLTVTHDDLIPESGMARSVAHGWPMVLSGLKSILETGHSLTMNFARCAPQPETVTPR
jgi:uncharacterized protein YndB with AHSA1/START domain